MRQQEIFTAPADIPLSRSSDPRSSREAERSAVESGLVATHEDRIAAAVQAQPGRTADELGAVLGMTNVQVLRRTRAMERKGKIRRGDQRPGLVSGRPGLTWFPA